VTSFQLIREVPTCLGNNLDTALYEPLPLPIALKSIERQIRQYGMDAFDSLDDVSQAGNERTCSH